MTCRLDGTEQLAEPILEYCYLNPQEQTSVKSQSKLYIFIQENGGHFVSASMC